MRNEMRRVISLEDPALFRFALIRVDNDHTIWFQKYHHIIIDVTGRRLLSARTASLIPSGLTDSRTHSVNQRDVSPPCHSERR